MAFGWDDAALAGMGLISSWLSGSKAKDANKKQEEWMDYTKNMMNQQWGFTQPWLQTIQPLRLGMGNLVGSMLGLPASTPKAPITSQYVNWLNKDYKVGDYVPRKMADQMANMYPGAIDFGERGKYGDGYIIMGIKAGDPDTSTPATPQMPSFMNLDWKNPMTAQQKASMTTLSDLGLDKYRQQMQGQVSGNLARRGLSPSSFGVSQMAGLDNAYNRAAAEEQARLGMFEMARGDQLRGEQSSNFWNMLQAAMGNPVDLSPYITQGMNMANIYGNQAQNYSNQASNLMAGLGNVIGMMLAAKAQNRQNPYLDYTTGGNTWAGGPFRIGMTNFNVGPANPF